MKNTKILVLVLSLALVLGAVAGITVSAADETLETTSIAIKSANLSFVNEPALVFAVEHDGDAANVSLNVWNSEPEENQAADYVVTDSFEQTIEGTAYTSFAVEGKNPKNIYEYVWVQAVAGEVKSEIVRYSILQYALGGVVNGANPERFQSIIDYSASAQKWLEYTDANGKTADEYVFVSVEGGTVDGYKNGVYPKGTKITPEGDGVSMWSVESGNNKYNSYYGQSITLNANTKITVNNSVMTFEDCTTPSDIGNGVTLKGSSDSTFKITDLDGNKVLAYDSINDEATGRTELIIDMQNTVTNAEAVVFETDFYIDETTKYDDNLYFEFRNASNQRVAFVAIETMSLRYYYDSTSAKIKDLTADTWYNLRIEYRNVGDTMELRVYLDDLPVLTKSNYVYTTNTAQIYDVTNIRFDTWREITVLFDNVVFMQEKIENLDKVITFDDGNIPSSVSKLTDTTNVTVANIKDKGNILQFDSKATYGEGFIIPVLDKAVGANCVVFEADISIDVIDSSGYPGVRFNLVNSAGKNTARFELKRNSEGKIQFVEYGCERHYTSAATTMAIDGNANWFNLRIEYYEGTRETVRTKVYLNGTLVHVYDNFMNNSECSTCNTTLTPATVDSITTLKVMSPSGNYSGTFLIDNIRFEHIVKVCTDDPITE